MKRTAIILILSALFICAMAITASAQAPNTIMYQGRLTNTDGTPRTGDVANVRFRIYLADHDSGLNAIYYELTTTISCDDNGVFTVELGPITNPGAFSGGTRYLGIKVGADDEMTPYQKLASTLYSLATEKAPGIAGGYNTGSYTTLTGTALNLDSAVITAPMNGYIVVLASAICVPLHVVGTKDLGRFSISTTSAVIDYDNLSNVTTPASATTDSDMPQSAFTQAIYDVTPGTYKYYFTADAWTGAPRATKAKITAMFFPTAYGVVDVSTKKMMPEELPDANSLNMSK